MTSFLSGARLALAACLLAAGTAGAAPSVERIAQVYSETVDRRLDVPADEADGYARIVQAALDQSAAAVDGAQYVLAVDRNPNVQAVFLLWRSAAGEWRLVGASPASTGRPGSFDHFETPIGVFEHSPANMDFRAEGTFNENGIRGYGRRGMRVFDFGWQQQPKGWGDGLPIEMRLQVHATDPDILEQRLGTAQSKGCIRIPATLNALLDHYGVLDALYDVRDAHGSVPWVLRPDRDPVENPGRYLVIVDSARGERPAWAVAVPVTRPH